MVVKKPNEKKILPGRKKQAPKRPYCDLPKEEKIRLGLGKPLSQLTKKEYQLLFFNEDGRFMWGDEVGDHCQEFPEKRSKEYWEDLDTMFKEICGFDDEKK